MKTAEKFWLWGYSLGQVPGPMPFVSGKTFTSCETAAQYLGAKNLYWLNPLHSLEAICEEELDRLSWFDNIIVGLTHIESNGPGMGGWQILYKEAAAKVSQLSLKYPNIKGAIIDDFRDPVGPSKNMTDDELKEVYMSLKSANPALKLHLVHYFTKQDPKDLASCREYFDGLALWNWHATDYFWDGLYEDTIRIVGELFADKTIIQGQFLHNYGDGGFPMPMEMFEKQCVRITKELDAGNIDGWCILQNGWFCRESHRKNVQFLRDYWDWYRGTRTDR